MPLENSKRGGPGRGQGRKPLKQGEDTVTLSLRMTLSQREKLTRIGGAAWLREKIESHNENGEISPAACVREKIKSIDAARLGWNPMETAPKDGTIIRLRDEKRMFNCVMAWDKKSKLWTGTAYGIFRPSRTYWDEEFCQPFEWQHISS